MRDELSVVVMFVLIVCVLTAIAIGISCVFEKSYCDRMQELSPESNFSWGFGTRTTSIRIPNHVSKQKCGYFEDRRPAANIDPYEATSIIFATCCL